MATAKEPKRTVSPRPIDPVVVTTVIERLVAEWLCNATGKVSARGHFSMGPCYEFAEDAADALRETLGPDVPIAVADTDCLDGLGYPSPTGEYHAWVVVAGVHYDAQSPKGVSNPLTLSFFRDRSRHYDNGSRCEDDDEDNDVDAEVIAAAEARGWLPGEGERNVQVDTAMRMDLDRAAGGVTERLPDLETALEAAVREYLKEQPDLAGDGCWRFSQVLERLTGQILEEEVEGFGIARGRMVENLLKALFKKQREISLAVRDGTFIVDTPAP